MQDFKLKFDTRMDSDAIVAAARAMDTVLDQVIPGWGDSPSTQNTPLRFVKYLAEYCQPLPTEEIFGEGRIFKIPDEHPGIVIQHRIPFRMMCEHHLLPAIGKAALAYIPNEKVIGLSKLCRLVDAVGVERPSLQEHIAERIIDLMKQHLKPRGVMVVIKAEHGCMACRGVAKPGVETVTSHVHGVFRDNKEARQEVLALV